MARQRPSKICKVCGLTFVKAKCRANKYWEKQEFCSVKCRAINQCLPKDNDGCINYLFSKTIKTITGCMEFQGAITRKGYGCASIYGKINHAHRHIYKLLHGDIPSNMYVCHKCDNRKCINPDHLFLATQAENLRDMVNKGRCRSGGYKKITTDVLDRIIALAISGETYKNIALEFGINHKYAGRIAIKNGIRRNVCKKSILT